MKKKGFLLQIIILAAINTTWGQQEALTTQYMYNKLVINPAFQSNESKGSVNIMARDQWLGFDGSLTSQVLSLALPVLSKNTQFGINVKRYSFGITKVNAVGLNYSYGVKTGSGFLSGGLEVGFRNYMFDYTDSRLVASQGIDIDPSIPKSAINRNNLNLGLGIYYRTEKFYLGVSSPYVFSNALFFDQNTVLSGEFKQILAMTGYQFKLNSGISLLTQSLVKLSTDLPFDLDVNANLIWKSKVEFGTGYRLGGNTNGLGESLIINGGFHIYNDLFIGLAYDYPLSDLRSVTVGNVELIARYQFERKKSNFKGFNPRFF